MNELCATGAVICRIDHGSGLTVDVQRDMVRCSVTDEHDVEAECVATLEVGIEETW